MSAFVFFALFNDAINGSKKSAVQNPNHYQDERDMNKQCAVRHEPNFLEQEQKHIFL
jgi:hypothetical protein